VENINKRVVSWVLVYWLISINTLAAIIITLFFGFYSYSSIVPNSVLAIFCAVVQLYTHIKNKNHSVPFYLQFISMYISAMLYLVFYESNSLSGIFTFNGVLTLCMVSFLFTLPLVLIAYFVKIRILKYVEIS
jgi:hypothetical protein